MSRRLPLAVVLSALAHGVLVVAGNSGLDSKPLHRGGGVGPAGDFEVVSLTARQADLLLARRGPVSIPSLLEAGGAGAPRPDAPSFAAPRPDGAQGAAVGGARTAVENFDRGRGGESAARLADLGGAIGQPAALPATDSGPPGSAALPEVASGEAQSEPTEGPDDAGANDPTGSEGLSADDAGAADGDRADGIDASAVDRYLLQGYVPDYPESVYNDRKRRGLSARVQARVRFTVDERGRVDSIELVGRTGEPLLDRRALEAIKRRRYDGQVIARRGWVGQPWIATLIFGADEPR